MRSFTSIFFLLCLSAPFLGSFSLLEVQKQRVKREIKRKMIAGISKEELAFLKFSKAELNSALRWEHSREFEYLEEMYDVVETAETEDSVYYWCWWDFEETALNRRLEVLLAEAMGEEDETENGRPNLKEFMEELFFLQQENNSNTYYTQLIANYFSPEVVFKSIRFAPPAPPPKSATYL